VQRLRHASDAILTGIGTVLADDPLLTDRTGLPRRRPLVRVVVDTLLRTPTTAKLVQTARENVQEDVWIFCGPDAAAERRTALEACGVKVTTVAVSGGLDLVEVLAHLHSARLLSVLLEAGSAINGAFLRRDLIDQAILYYSEMELGAGAVAFAEGSAGPFTLEERMQGVSTSSVGGDIRVSGLLHDPWATAPRFS
jgi:diaminohydroxyphosphoribosylaminopyrimidine deaminase/5-amino-6-(5-phosphoribosylamino)uracil reductase